LSVCDDGPGIAPGMLSQVFEPFYTTKGAGQGTGLGLAQVYGFAVNAGGIARINSQPGVGTTVTLWLKVHPNTLPTTPVPPPQAASPL